jgi:hypothetical protein
MASFALHFARALEGGRRLARPTDTRPALLVSLLNKRATAQAMGASDLEAMLRSQILWALPTLTPQEDEACPVEQEAA